MLGKVIFLFYFLPVFSCQGNQGNKKNKTIKSLHIILFTNVYLIMSEKNSNRFLLINNIICKFFLLVVELAEKGGHPNSYLLPKTCGIRNQVTNRIIGGKNANLGQFPWMARLFFRCK